MTQFVHLHVHTQYSILDGQASIQRLVDKAMNDGQPGIAVTDHGDMFGIKEFYNYVKKVKGKFKDKAAENARPGSPPSKTVRRLRQTPLRRSPCASAQEAVGGAAPASWLSSPSSAAGSTWRAAGCTTRRESPTRAVTT